MTAAALLRLPGDTYAAWSERELTEHERKGTSLAFWIAAAIGAVWLLYVLASPRP